MLPSKIRALPDKIKDTLQRVADQYSKGNVQDVIIVYKRPDETYSLITTADEIETIYALEKAKLQLLVGE
jgi:hypothetical protein